jgi:hypothetical protein
MDSSGLSAEDFVPVPVPAPLVVGVMAFIASQSIDRGVVDPTAEEALAAESSTANKVTKEWTPEILSDIARGRLFTTRLLTKIMDKLAETPDTWMNSAELAGKIGENTETVKGIWSHVGRHHNARFEGLPWPLDARWGLSLTPARDAYTYYRLTDDQVALWKEARSLAS